MKKYGKTAVILGCALALSAAGFCGCGKAAADPPSEGYGEPLPPESEAYQRAVSEDGGEAYWDSQTTVILDGQTFDIRDREENVNGIFRVHALDGYWLVEAHISPNVGYYGFYNRETLQWEQEFTGALLTWYGAEGDTISMDISMDIPFSMDIPISMDIPFSMDTVVYVFGNELYDAGGTLLGTIPLAEGEFIHGLKRTDTEVEIYILNAETEERMLPVEVPSPA